MFLSSLFHFYSFYSLSFCLSSFDVITSSSSILISKRFLNRFIHYLSICILPFFLTVYISLFLSFFSVCISFFLSFFLPSYLHSSIHSLREAIYNICLSEVCCSSLLVWHAMYLAVRLGLNTKLTNQDFVVNCSLLRVSLLVNSMSQFNETRVH